MGMTNKMRAILISAVLLLSPCLAAAGDEERYDAVDRHALSVPASAAESVDALSSYLTKPFDSDEEKVRAIFRWITENISYDVEGYFSGHTTSDCGKVLESRSSVCGGYSSLFETLCKKAGLQVVTIGGYCKGFSYHAGDKVTDERNHAWNAVKIRGEWKFVDCTWGAGKVDEEHNYLKEFEPYFFLTKPEEFIYRHFPVEKQWQLLSKPLSRQEFEDLPLVSPVYFQCGLKLIGMQSTVLDIRGEYIVELSAPADVLVTATLELNGKVAEDAVFIQHSEYIIQVRIMPPEEGEYYLHIFASRVKDAVKIPLAISYKVTAHIDGKKNNLYPQVFKTFVETNTQLEGPLTKELSAGSMQFFSLISPGAEKVAVVYEDEWDFLKKSGNRFEGMVEIGAGKISVYAQYPGKREYQALLEYTGTGSYRRAPRPLKYEQFTNSGAELLSPLKKELTAGTAQVFRVKLPGAKKAAVILDDEWKYLQKNGNYFEGTIDIGKGKIVVVGAYTSTTKFEGLLEFEGK
jgi:hypothetical protein